MKKYSENEIEERYALLPENLKTALSGVDSIEKLKQIIEKHDLHVDHAGEIADAVELVLVGLMKVRDFESALYDALPLIDRAKVKAISDNVNISIFDPVRSSLQEIDQNTPTPHIEESSKIVTPPKKAVGIKSPLFAAKPPQVSPPVGIEHEIMHTKDISVEPVVNPAHATPGQPEPVHTAKSKEIQHSNEEVTTIAYKNTDPKLKMIPREV